MALASQGSRLPSPDEDEGKRPPALDDSAAQDTSRTQVR